MGPYGPIWVARGEKNNAEKVKIIICDSDFFRGLCPGDEQLGRCALILQPNGKDVAKLTRRKIFINTTHQITTSHTPNNTHTLYI